MLAMWICTQRCVHWIVIIKFSLYMKWIKLLVPPTDIRLTFSFPCVFRSEACTDRYFTNFIPPPPKFFQNINLQSKLANYSKCSVIRANKLFPSLFLISLVFISPHANSIFFWKFWKINEKFWKKVEIHKKYLGIRIKSFPKNSWK